MNLNEFIEYVESAAAEYSLKVDVLARTENAVKIRLEITPTIFVQFYHTKSRIHPIMFLLGGIDGCMEGIRSEASGTDIRIRIIGNMIRVRKVRERLHHWSSWKKCFGYYKGKNCFN